MRKQPSAVVIFQGTSLSIRGPFPVMVDTSSSLPPKDQALAWFARINSGDATAEDVARFEAWLAANPMHRKEYGKLAGLWADLEALPDPRPAKRPLPLRGLTRRSLLIGGTIVGAGAVVAGLSGTATVWAADFRTGTGERKSMTAADGTRIELDAGTAVLESYTSARRRLDLLQGRALFVVADDPDRPFEVACRDGICTAKRASFVLHCRAGDVEVAVEAESVRVLAGGPGGVEVRAGQCLAYGSSGLGAIHDTDGDTALAWQRGKLAFRDRPLDDVIADLNRYREGTIVIADRSLASLRLDGIFDMSHPEAALQAILSTLPVHAWRLTDYLIVLRSA